MESKLLPAAPSDSSTEVVSPVPQMSPEAEALVEVRRAIIADSRMHPEQYLEEILVPAAGE